MRNTKTLFLLTLFCHTIFSSDIPCKQLTTFVVQPHLVAWLGNHQAFVGSENGYVIVDTTDNFLIKKIECENVWDVAVNKTKTQYAVSLFGKIECFLLEGHTPLWELPHDQTIYTPITFNSQNENQVIYRNVVARYNSPLSSNPENENILSFSSGTKYPISCNALETKIIYFKKGEKTAIYTSTKEGSWRMIRGKGKLLIEVRYTSDGEYIVYNYQHELWVRDALSKNDRCLASIQTPNSCIAFEGCNNQFIAALTKDNIISYYQYPKRDLVKLGQAAENITQPKLQYRIAENLVEQNAEKQDTENDTPAKRLSLSSDGTKFLVALSDRCIVVGVPLIVLCGQQEADKLFALYRLLRPFI